MTRRQEIQHLLALIADDQKAKVPQEFKKAWKKFRQNKDKSEWLKDARICGFGLARKVTKGQVLSEYVLKVYVREKVSYGDVASPVPPFVALPDVGLNVATDVEATGAVKLDANIGLFSRDNPASPGFSVSHPDANQGTLGCIVIRDFDLFVLSVSHVIANYGLGVKEQDPVLYPAALDGGAAPQDVLGILVDFTNVVPGESNPVDAAIARVVGPVSSFIPWIGVPVGVNETPQENANVRIFGRTSSFRKGEILSLNSQVTAPWRVAGGALVDVTLTGQIRCTKYSEGGDSGAAVIDDNNCVVGMHVASDDVASYFTPIRAITTALGVSVLTENV